MKLSDIDKSVGTKVLVIGNFGMGKTWFAGSAPQPIDWYDFDAGTSTLLKRFAGAKVDPEIDIHTFNDIPKIARSKKISTSVSASSTLIGTINKSPRAYIEFEEDFSEILDGRRSPKTVVFDSLTNLEKIFMNYIMAVNSGQGRVMGAPNQGDYGVFVRKFEELLNYMLLPASFGINIICTAHIQTKKDEITGRVIHEPALIGKSMPSAIGAYFDEVYVASTRSSKTGVQYNLQIQPSREHNCKTRRLITGTDIFMDQDEVSNQLWGAKKTNA